LPCRRCQATNEVRCMATTRHGFVLTGHIDGYVRAWNLDGTKLESESWPAELRMHNTGITVLVEDYEGAIWTASMAGSVRCISQDGKKTSIEAKAPGRKNAHNTEVNAMIATANKTLWTGAKTVRVWSSEGEWRQSLQTHAGKVLCMLSSRGKVWIGFADGRLLLFDQASAVCIVKLQDEAGNSPVHCLAAGDDHVWSGSGDGHVRCYSEKNFRETIDANRVQEI